LVVLSRRRHGSMYVFRETYQKLSMTQNSEKTDRFFLSFMHSWSQSVQSRATVGYLAQEMK
jgi:hypothetical protein